MVFISNKGGGEQVLCVCVMMCWEPGALLLMTHSSVGYEPLSFATSSALF